MVDKKIKVYILKAKGLSHSASGNRHEMIIKMVEQLFETIIIEKEFFVKKSLIEKILNGLKFRLQLGLSAFNIPRFRNNEKNIILLFSVDALTSLIVKIISSLRGNKLIIERNEFPVVLRTKNNLTKIIYRFFILSWQYKLYDGLFIMTDELICFYKKLVKKNCIIEKLPMTVDFSRFDNLKEGYFEEKYIAYVGSLSNEKDGVEYLIKAFEKISEKFPDVTLKIAGGKPNEINLYKKDIVDCRFGVRIEFLGIVGRNLIPIFLQNAMILVLPRPDSLQAKGGFPTKLGEYLATSKPVIVTRVGEIAAYLNDDEVFFIEPDNIDGELESAINKVLSNYNYALQVGSNGRQKALKYFSLDVNKDRIYNLIKQIGNQ